MNAADLLILNKADDKNYLLGKNISLVHHSLLEISFTSNDPTIHFEEIPQFQSMSPIQQGNQKEILENNTWLLSMGAIVLFGENVEDSEILLIQRDQGARHDPLKYTMPAGRLDTTLSKGCMAELFEEVIIEGEDCYYQFDKGVCDCSNIQKSRIENLGLSKKEFQTLVSKDFSAPNLFTVRIFLDDREIDNLENVFLYIDTNNKTLEFRQLLLCNKPHDIISLHDGDNYGRNIRIQSLKNFSQQEKSIDYQNCTPTLQYFLQKLSL